MTALPPQNLIQLWSISGSDIKNNARFFINGFATCHAIWWMDQKIEKSLPTISFVDCQKNISHQWKHSLVLITHTLPSNLSNSNCWKWEQHDKSISWWETYTLWLIALSDHTSKPVLRFRATYQLLLFKH